MTIRMQPSNPYAAQLATKLQEITFGENPFYPYLFKSTLLPVPNAELDPQVVTTQLLTTVVRAHNQIQAKRASFSEEDRASLKMLLAIYINQIWISETPPDESFDPQEVVLLLLEQGGDLTDRLQQMDVKNAQHVARKITNLYNAATTLFGLDSNCEYLRDRPLSIELAKEVHTMIGTEIFSVENLGQYRTVQVQPFGSNTTYASPNKIESRLKTLFQFTNEQKLLCDNQSPEQKTRQMILLATLFFSEFLHIHPFRDGNGRTARLLFTVLLHQTIIVPFTIYPTGHSSPSPRTIYIKAIEQAHVHGGAPSSLATLFLLSAQMTAHKVEVLFAE